MSRAVTLLLLAAPVVLSFRSGGYFSDTQRVAALVGLALLAVTVVGLPLRRGSSMNRSLTVGGIAVLTGWTALSSGWAPLSEPAQDDAVRLLLYLSILLCATVALAERRVARWVEPGLVLGAFVVVTYGLAGRLVPGLIELSRSVSAEGRLEQPLTYWNAMGVLAALGAVLAARIVGDPSRAVPGRMAAAAAAAPLGAALALTLSRGAIAAFAGGLVAIVLLAPERAQLRAAALVGLTAVLAAAPALALEAVRTLEGSPSARTAQGAAAAVALTIIGALAAAATRAIARRGGDARPLGISPRGRFVAACITALVLTGPIFAAAAERSTGARVPDVSRGAGRLTEVRSNRYDYWTVSVQAFADHPLAGVGSGGFRSEWNRERPVAERAVDAHSLPIETAAELGVVGLLALLCVFAGTVRAGAAGLRHDRDLVAGWCAGLVVFAYHSAIDWDMEMPAVALVAVILAGALLSREAETPRTG